MDKLKEWFKANKVVGCVISVAIVVALVAVVMLCLEGKDTKNTDPVVSPSAAPVPSDTPTVAPTDTPTPEPTEAMTPTPTPDMHIGMVRSTITNQWIPAEEANKRPVACMISNVDVVDPQSGIGSADVLYEAMNGGGVTRMCAIIENYENLKRLGSIRSARLYFIQWAMGWDPILLHYGGPHIYVDETLNTPGVDNLDGCGNMEGTAFYRDYNIKSPHNAFGSGQGVIAGAQKKGYSLTHTSKWNGTYWNFASDETPNMLENGSEATYVEPGYNYNKPSLQYNAEDGLYYRYQFGRAHKDAITGEQLAFKNVIIQICECKVLDDQNYLWFNTISKGQSGYFITNGKCVPITWSKASLWAPTKYYMADGSEIQLNTGRTMICVVATSAKDKVVIK